MSLTLHGVTDELTPEYLRYADALKTAGDAFHDAEKLFTDKRKGWEKDTTTWKGETVYYRMTDKGKMVSITSELEGDMDIVMRDIWQSVEGMPEWNKGVDYSQIIARPTEHFDIISYGNEGNVLVSGRDYITARIYRKVDDAYLIASRSVCLPELPKPEGYERACLHLAAARLHSLPGREDKTVCEAIVQTDLKGMLPSFMVNWALGKMLLKETRCNQEHFDDLKEKRIYDQGLY